MGMGEKGKGGKTEVGEKGETVDVVGRRGGLKAGMCVVEGKSRRAQEESRGQEEDGDTRERVIPRYHAEGKSKVGEIKQVVILSMLPSGHRNPKCEDKPQTG